MVGRSATERRRREEARIRHRSAAFAAETAPYASITRVEPELVIAKMRLPWRSRLCATRSCVQKQIDMTVDVMAHSLVYWVQELVSANLMEKGGRIFAMTSAGGSRVLPSYGPVSAAKAILESHIRQLAMELAPRRITANALRAGVTDTPALRKIPGHEKLIESARLRNPQGRLTTPQDVAAAVGVLAQLNTYWITGNVIGVDGGEDIVG